MELQRSENSFTTMLRGRRIVKFFEITGCSLVHPLSYKMQEFQKQIILTAIFRNTLVSLPPGLGMPYLASVITYNFQRWFLNGKIVVLSQTKSCITELINAYQSYTTLSEELYCDIFGTTSANESETTWNKPIILSSPVKYLENIKNKICKIDDLVLLIIYETNKITRSQEYKEIMNILRGIEFRTIVFVDGCGFSSKAIKQVIDTFDISQIEFRNLFSPDIKECTFSSEIESVALEISPHMISIKEAFYSVYEKYGKLLKDAKVINGNVASFTKYHIQKAKEKLIKAPPQNVTKEIQQNLLDGMTMCSFLCTGIEILHNWGVRSFYNYLFDENKDGELKRLIVKDDLLKNQMKLLNEYLKSNGRKVESLMSKIIHPKLLFLKNLIIKFFSEAEGSIDDIRIVIFCTVEDVVDEVDRLISTLPDFIRHQCIKTKFKSLANTNEYKEVIQNFNNGVINVLILNNLVDEVTELGTNLIISLEPNKTLVKFSDPRFYKGADKCFFILTKGNEYNKFETLLNEKKNEQKLTEFPDMDQILKTSPSIFPEGFNPDFESTSVASLVRNTSQNVGQKSILNYLKPDSEKKSKKSVSLFDDSDFIEKSIFVPKNPQRELSRERYESPLFESKYDDSELKNGSTEIVEDTNYDPLYISPQKVPYAEQMAKVKFLNDDDSFDDLLLDFSESRCKNTKKPIDEKPPKSTSNEGNSTSLHHEIKANSCVNDLNHNSFKPAKNTSSLMTKLQSLRETATTLKHDMNHAESPSILNTAPESPKAKSPPVFDVNEIFDFNSTALRNEMLEDFSLFDNSKDKTGVVKDSKSSISVVNDTVENRVADKSPILSGKKSNKKLSKNGEYPLKECSPSIHFQSSFEIDDDFSLVNNLRKEDAPVEENPPLNVDNIDDWDPDCELFQDDDTFDDIVLNVKTPRKEVSNVITSPVTNSVIQTEKVILIDIEEPIIIVTPPKNSVPIKVTSTIANSVAPSKEMIPVEFDAPVTNSVTPQKELIPVKTSTPIHAAECKKNSPIPRPQLPKRNLPPKNSVANNCDINISDNCRKKAISNSFFSNFSLKVKQKSQNNSQVNQNTRNERPNQDDDCDEFPWSKSKFKPPEKPKLKVNLDDEVEYPWLKESSVIPSSTSNSPSVIHSTPEFKKPSPIVIRSSASRSAQSSSSSDNKSLSSENTPDLKPVTKKKKKRLNLQRNLAMQFLDNEAEVTDDSDDTNTESLSHVSDEDDSFIDDDVRSKKSNYSHYLKSIKSPRTELGKFRIPVLSESKLRANVCSQMDYFDQTYQQDSFCVDEVEDEPDSEYIPSVLTQMEDKLKREKKKTKRLIRISEGSSDEESNVSVHRKKKHRKRIMCFSSSDSEAE